MRDCAALIKLCGPAPAHPVRRPVSSGNILNMKEITSDYTAIISFKIGITESNPLKTYVQCIKNDSNHQDKKNNKTK